MLVCSVVVLLDVCLAAAQDAGRPIRYPAKIASTLQELMSGVDGVMAGLRQMLKEHMATEAKRLRAQVRAGYQSRLLHHFPLDLLES
jgi:hypothetical protein